MPSLGSVMQLTALIIATFTEAILSESLFPLMPHLLVMWNDDEPTDYNTTDHQLSIYSTETTFLFFTSAVFSLLIAPLVGMSIDIFSVYATSVACLICQILSCVTFAFGCSFIVFCIGRMIFTIASAGLLVVSAYSITYLVQCKVTQSRILAIPVFVYGLTSAGELYAALTYEAFGQKTVFIVPAVITLACLILLSIGHWLEKSTYTRFDDEPFRCSDLPLLLNKYILISAFLMFIVGLIRNTATVVLPMWTAEQFDAGVSEIGMIWLPPTIAYCFVMIFTTYIVGREFNCFIIAGVYAIISAIPVMIIPMCQSLTCVTFLLVSPASMELSARYAIVTFLSVSVASLDEFRGCKGTINGIISFSISGNLVLAYTTPLLYREYGIGVFWGVGGIEFLVGFVSLYSYRQFQDVHNKCTGNTGRPIVKSESKNESKILLQ